MSESTNHRAVSDAELVMAEQRYSDPGHVVNQRVTFFGNTTFVVPWGGVAPFAMKPAYDAIVKAWAS